MCGIAGILRYDEKPVDPDRLDGMLAHLRHRGPDGEGVSTHGPCGLAHARLSVIDLLSGTQPMHVDAGQVGSHDHGPIHLIYNGEIYNHRSLRRMLHKRGHQFTSDHSDSEVLLMGYRQFGEQLPKHLHGMYAFAIYDEQKQELFLCRDRVGKKPLYLWHGENEIVFASLVSAMAAGMPKGQRLEPDPDAMLEFLRLGYPQHRSMIKGVTEVPPGHWMRIDLRGRVACERYWQPPPVSKHSTALGAVDALREVLRESVQRRLESDVELGCFLSGGIDSSVVAAMAQAERKARGEPSLQTFSMAMPDVLYDETPLAQAVVGHLGTRHTVLETHPGDILDDLQRLMRVSGEPTADSSILPTYWLCRAAREHVTVALSGDGGDELMGGYDRYRAMRWLGQYRMLLRWSPHLRPDPTHPKSRKTRIHRLQAASLVGKSPARQYQSLVHLFTDRQIAKLAPGQFNERLSANMAAVPDWPALPDPVQAAMRWDLTHYLSHELLRKIDRASMAVALEVRCPILGTEVCDLAGHLPPRVLMPGGRPKGLLRALASEMLPAKVVNARKRGFAVPIGSWLRDDLYDPVAGMLRGGDLETLGLDPRPARRWLDHHRSGRQDHTHRLFALLQLALWARWLKDPQPHQPA